MNQCCKLVNPEGLNGTEEGVGVLVGVVVGVDVLVGVCVGV
jgi:hypothetical protein